MSFSSFSLLCAWQPQSGGYWIPGRTSVTLSHLPCPCPALFHVFLIPYLYEYTTFLTLMSTFLFRPNWHPSIQPVCVICILGSNLSLISVFYGFRRPIFLFSLFHFRTIFTLFLASPGAVWRVRGGYEGRGRNSRERHVIKLSCRSWYFYKV